MRLFPRIGLNSDRRGVTTVEMAFAAPVLFMVIMSSIEVSRLNMLRNTAANAAYDGARRGILPGATSANVISAANVVLSAGSAISTTVTVTPSTITDMTKEVTVTVKIPVATNSWLMNSVNNWNIERTCTLTREKTGNDL